MISRKAIMDAFEVMLSDQTVSTVVVFCNRFTEAVRIDRWKGGGGIHKGTYLTSMGSLFPEEKAYLTRNKKKYGSVEASPKVWIRYR